MKSITNTQAPAIIEDIVRAPPPAPAGSVQDYGQQFAQHHSVHHRRGRRRGAQGAFTVRKRGFAPSQDSAASEQARTANTSPSPDTRSTHGKVPDMGGTRRHHGRFLHPLPHP